MRKTRSNTLGATAAGWVVRTLTVHDLDTNAPGKEAKTQFESLARKYGLSSWRMILTANGLPSSASSSAINAWIQSVGGKQNQRGYWVFQVGNKIKLPAQAAVPEPKGPTAPVASAVVGEGLGPWYLWLGAGLLGFAIFRKKKKPSTKKGTRKRKKSKRSRRK